MTIITGDKHGDFRRVDALCSSASTTKDDLLIILGDAGINFYGGKREVQFKHMLAKLPGYAQRTVIQVFTGET